MEYAEGYPRAWTVTLHREESSPPSPREGAGDGVEDGTSTRASGVTQHVQGTTLDLTSWKGVAGQWRVTVGRCCSARDVCIM